MQLRYSNRLPESSYAFDNLQAEVTIKGQTVVANILAIAPRELRVKVPVFCPRWTSVGIRLSNRFIELDSVAFGEVHWFKRSDTEWELGIWLDEELDESVVGAYWQDMRRELRYEVNWGAVAQWPDGDRKAIRITDYSLSGMSFNCSSTITSRSEFLIWKSYDTGPAVASGIASWTTASAASRHIVGCRLPGNTGYELARSFTEQPIPYSSTRENEQRLKRAEELLKPRLT